MSEIEYCCSELSDLVYEGSYIVYQKETDSNNILFTCNPYLAEADLNYIKFCPFCGKHLPAP